MTVNDELRPLLSQQPRDLSSVESQKPAPTPVPTLSLGALCACRLVEPVTFTQIFPYINEFILRLTHEPAKVAYHSGIVESAFAVAQLASIYQWAKLSDKFGRRSMILLSVAGLTLTTITFGLSTSLTGVFVSRCISGLFAGNIAVIHSALGELTDSSNQSVVFPIYGLFWPLGAILGPLLGGTFADPQTKFPHLFTNQFWTIYPYFLPCLTTSLVGLFAVLIGYCYLAETLPSKRRKDGEKKIPAAVTTCNQYGATSDASKINASSNGNSPSLKALLSIPIIRALCISGFALSFISTAFDVVFVLFCYTSICEGGLGFTPSEIGFSLVICGTISALIQLLVMPTLLRTFNIARMYTFSMNLWPATFLLIPFLNVIARAGLAVEDKTGMVDPYYKSLLWAGIVCLMILSRVCCVSYSLSMILVKDNSSPVSLGAANGLVQFAQCLSRAVSPVFISSAFALSVNKGILFGHGWVVLMVVFCLISCCFNKSIIDADMNKDKDRVFF